MDNGLDIPKSKSLVKAIEKVRLKSENLKKLKEVELEVKEVKKTKLDIKSYKPKPKFVDTTINTIVNKIVQKEAVVSKVKPTNVIAVNVNPFLRKYKEEGGEKVFESDLNKVLSILDKKKLFFGFTNYTVNSELSCKALRLQSLLYDMIDTLIVEQDKILKLSPTDINKILKFKSLSSIYDGLSELVDIGLLSNFRKYQYFFNPFYFFVGTSEQLLLYLKEDIKSMFPKLYVKLFVKT